MPCGSSGSCSGLASFLVFQLNQHCFVKSIFAYLAGQAKRCSLALVVAAAGVLPAAGQTIYGREFSYGLNNPSLMSFTAANPGTILARTAITGIANGETLVGLDFRPATSELFGLGYNASTQTGRLYVLNLTTAVATPVGAAPG